MSNIMVSSHTDPSIFGFDHAKEIHFSSVLLQRKISITLLEELGGSVVEFLNQDPGA